MEERIKSQLEDLLAWVDDEMSSFKREEEISKLLDQSVQAILTAVAESEIEVRRDQIHKDLGGQSFHMPIKSARNRNTAFKLYAIKFFNGTIKKRRENALAQLGKEEKHE